LDHEIFQQKTIGHWGQQVIAMDAKDGSVFVLVRVGFENSHKLVQSLTVRAAKIYGWAAKHGRRLLSSLFSGL
jgi:hypothetical protein